MSLQREHVEYQFERDRFRITFLAQEPQQAQQLLEDWQHAESKTYENTMA
jgi:hypothetical protein